MALDFTTYTGLIAAIAETLNRSDLVDSIPGWVALAEERHQTEVRIREMLARETVTIDGRIVDLPDGFLEMKRLQTAETETAKPYNVELVTGAVMTEKFRSPTVAGAACPPWDRPVALPRYYTADGDLEFEVDPTDYDATPVAKLHFYRALTPLGAGVPTNALLARAPGAYFYGALVHSAPYLLDDARIATWRELYASLVVSLNANDRKRGGPLASRVSGATP